MTPRIFDRSTRVYFCRSQARSARICFREKRRSHPRSCSIKQPNQRTEGTMTMMTYQRIRPHSSRIQEQVATSRRLYLVKVIASNISQDQQANSSHLDTISLGQSNALESALCCQMAGWIIQTEREEDRSILEGIFRVPAKSPTHAFDFDKVSISLFQYVSAWQPSVERSRPWPQTDRPLNCPKMVQRIYGGANDRCAWTSLTVWLECLCSGSQPGFWMTSHLRLVYPQSSSSFPHEKILALH
jgi:hypothetical protein